LSKKELLLYLILGSIVYGATIIILNSLLWILFFLLFISLLITLRVSNTNHSFGKQFFSVCIWLFFFGWIAVLIILIVKVLFMYLYSLLS
jgi:hypothetical protein